MSKPEGEAFNLIMRDTGLGYALSVINGKYKMIILFSLYQYGIIRFNELHRMIKPISIRTLSVTLKQMESDGLINRKEFPQVPPKVEYSLADKGKSLIPILQLLCSWGSENKRNHSVVKY
jgi:DNA-binding HxlR family transcriptional regulator